MPDLPSAMKRCVISIFTFLGDYTHKTNAQGLINGIPNAISSPGSTTLPNGNTVSPNGNILDPQGNVVGQTAPTLNVVGANNVLVNPYDQFTATASVEKYINRGVLRVSGSVAKTEYESTEHAPDYGTKTLRGYGGYWLGPMFYIYSDTSAAWNNFAANATAAASAANAYRAVGGLGTARIGLIRGYVYAGHQGSNTQSTAGSSSAGGDVYGGKIAL